MQARGLRSWRCFDVRGGRESVFYRLSYLCGAVQRIITRPTETRPQSFVSESRLICRHSHRAFCPLFRSIQYLLMLWEEELDERPPAEANSPAGKRETAIYHQVLMGCRTEWPRNLSA